MAQGDMTQRVYVRGSPDRYDCLFIATREGGERGRTVSILCQQRLHESDRDAPKLFEMRMSPAEAERLARHLLSLSEGKP